jgi:hypothetical protein
VSKSNPPNTATDIEPWLYRVGLLADSLGSASRQAMTATFGIATAEWRLLLALDSSDTRSPTELARRLGLSDVVISRALAKLHRSGHLIRSADESDARKFNIRINAKGISLRTEVTAWWINYEAAVLSGVSPQTREALLALLRQCAQRSARYLMASHNDVCPPHKD